MIVPCAVTVRPKQGLYFGVRRGFCHASAWPSPVASNERASPLCVADHAAMLPAAGRSNKGCESALLLPLSTRRLCSPWPRLLFTSRNARRLRWTSILFKPRLCATRHATLRDGYDVVSALSYFRDAIVRSSRRCIHPVQQSLTKSTAELHIYCAIRCPLHR